MKKKKDKLEKLKLSKKKVAPYKVEEKQIEAQLKNTSLVFLNSGLQGKQVKVLKKDNTSKLLLGLSFVSLALIMVVVGQFFVMESEEPMNMLRKGTTINGLNVGGVNSYDAEQLIYEMFKKKSENFKLEIVYKNRSWVFSKEDFKVNSEIHTIIEEAMTRNQLLENKELQKQKLEEFEKDGVNINVAFNYIFVGLDSKIDNIIKEIEVEPINSEIKFDCTKSKCFEITNHKFGLRVNKEKLYYDINEQFAKTNNIKVEIEMIEEAPETTKQQNELNTTKLSTFQTFVADSTGGRKHNVKKALSCFNGLVVEPQQEISFNKITGPHSKENGYKNAIVIYNGKYVDGVGGGICQASTTLYNALLLADVEILEVHKHSLPVKYVPLAMDAMVSEYVADMKFKNNSSSPIYIQTFADSESVRVNVYGKKLDKTIKTRSETIKVLKPQPDKILFDTKKEYTNKVLFKGEQYRLTYPKNGYEAKAYVMYYKDGKLVEEKEVRSEVYQPHSGVVVEGVEEVPAGMNIIEQQDMLHTSNMHNNINTDFVPTNVSP